MPNLRVDDETMSAIKRIQGYFLMTEGRNISQGEAIKRVLKETRIEFFEEKPKKK